MNQHILIILDTGEKIQYSPTQWKEWDIGENFLVLTKEDSRNDLYSLNHIVSVRQSENPFTIN